MVKLKFYLNLTDSWKWQQLYIELERDKGARYIQTKLQSIVEIFF